MFMTFITHSSYADESKNLINISLSFKAEVHKVNCYSYSLLNCYPDIPVNHRQK